MSYNKNKKPSEEGLKGYLVLCCAVLCLAFPLDQQEGDSNATAQEDEQLRYRGLRAHGIAPCELKPLRPRTVEVGEPIQDAGRQHDSQWHQS